MTAEEIRRMEERVAQVRAEMERACRAAGRAPGEVLLCAASKTQNSETVRAAAALDIDLFGENRVQELCEKYAAGAYSGKPLHFIGHLQTNKVRQLIGKVSLIESVDTERLLDLIDKESLRAGVTTRVLLQLHVAREETKFGFSVDELDDYFTARRFESLKATHICGLMGMASNTDDTDRIAADFAAIAACYDRIRSDASLGLRGFDTLSMGMSDDRDIAIAQGSNLVRVGTAIFGAREY